MIRHEDSKAKRRFLFLQGPISPFFAEVAAGLRHYGHRVFRVNLNLGDWVFWRGPDGVNFTGKPEAWRAWIEAFMDEQAISDLVLLGEQRFYHREAIAAAKVRGIPVVVTDYGYLRPDWVTLELDGMGGNSLFPRDPDDILRRAEGLSAPDLSPLHDEHFSNMAVMDVLYHVLAEWPFPFWHYRRHHALHPFLVYAGLARRIFLLRRIEEGRSKKVFEGLKKRGTPFWLFAMQLESDFAIRAYSPFPDLDTALRKVIASFSAHAPRHAELLVKLHPLDPCMKNWPKRIAVIAREAGLAGRVHVVPRGDLDAMLHAAQGMITVNSTAASNALALDRPVTFLGRSIFDIPGLAFQGGLDDFWTQAAAPDRALRDAVVALLCGAFMVRGGHYGRTARVAAVRATVERLDRHLINLPLPHLPRASTEA
ncbi:MAG: capsular biosynthesis protein [Roseomonas sp.]|nr:capsular biosynthesis protein [Roseomonas sp.]